MRALVLLDPSAIDLLKAFMSMRDHEHDGYCELVILPDFVKQYGWHDETAIRFGIFFYLDLLFGGREGMNFNEIGLLTAARNMIAAERFAKLVFAEAIEILPAYYGDYSELFEGVINPFFLHLMYLQTMEKRDGRQITADLSRYRYEVLSEFARLMADNE